MLAKCLILGVLLVSLAAAVQSTGLEEPSFQPTSSHSAQPIQSNGSEEPTSSPIATATQSDDTCAEWKSRFGELNCCGTDYRTAKTFANSTRCHTIRADYRRGCNMAGRCTAPNGGTQPGTQTTTTNPAQNQADPADPADPGGSTGNPDNSGGSDDQNDSGGSDDPDDSEGSTGNPDNSGGSDDPDNSGGSDDPDNSGGSDDPDDSGGSDDPDDSGGSTGNPDNSGGSDDQNDSGGSDDPDDSEPDETGTCAVRAGGSNSNCAAATTRSECHTASNTVSLSANSCDFTAVVR